MGRVEIRACRPRIQLSLKICERCSQTSGASRRIAPQVCVTQQLHGWLGLGLRFGDEGQNFTHERSMWTWKRKMLRTSKQKHNKQCIWSFSWEMGLEADWCPHAAVCCAVLCWAGCTQEDQGWGCLSNQGQHKILIKSSNIPLSFGSDA